MGLRRWTPRTTALVLAISIAAAIGALATALVRGIDLGPGEDSFGTQGAEADALGRQLPGKAVAGQIEVRVKARLLEELP